MKRNILDTIRNYKLEEVKIGMIGSHSALDIAAGATDEGFQTVVICEKGREKTYSRYKRIVTEQFVLDRFDQLLEEKIQEKLIERNVIFVPNRSLTAYIPVEKIENEFFVPMVCNRGMLKLDDERNLQYKLLDDAGIEHPRVYKSYKDIDRLCIVKAKEPKKKIERAFFTAASSEEFLKKYEARFGESSYSPFESLEEQLETGDIWIEEFVLGAQFNFNYFYSPLNFYSLLKEEVEFLGVDRRIQTNLDGLLRLPAEEQIGRNLNPEYVEIGHEGATIRESMLGEVYDLGERFVASSKRLYQPHGIIGPFALQGAVTPNKKIIVYDLSPRMPGSPVLYSSPYSKYYFGFNVTSGGRVAMEIRKAIETRQLDKIIT